MRYLFLYEMIIVIIPWLVVLIVSWVGVENMGGGGGGGFFFLLKMEHWS